MTRVASDIAFTSSVKAVQTRLGSRDQYARTEQENEWSTTVTPELREFLAERDSFYLATASAEAVQTVPTRIAAALTRPNPAIDAADSRSYARNRR